MDKVRKKRSNKYLQGHSLMEVMVSTIIILLAFLFFSVLLGQLMSSRRLVPETALLLTMHSFRGKNGTIDTMVVKGVYSQSSVKVTNETVARHNFQHVQIIDRNTNKLLLQYYTLPDTVDINGLFQQ